ncbi:Hemin transport protein HemS [compost metagenome]
MVFVGNQHCIQIHSGPVKNLRWLDTWFNVLDPEFNLHLKTPGITELWRVRKPSSDGVITSWEAFDADGELVVQLFGARKPGIPEREDWRQLAESTPALPA